jgi:hypothetical protein
MARIKSKFNEEQLIEIQTQIDKDSTLYEYRSKDYPFEVIESKYGDEENNEASLYVPNYQRKFVWKPDKQSKFIESVLLGVPLAPFLVSEDEDGRLEIIDGSQRIRTLIAFYENKLSLRKLKKLDQINSARYKDLPKRSQTYFKNRDFKFIIADNTKTEIKQDIFERINTSGEKLTDSEIRKGSYAGNFYNLILELKQDEKFIAICPITKTKLDRGEYEELILRFFAYIDKYNEFKHDVAIFLNDYLEEMNENDFNRESYINYFNKMTTFISTHFSNGFRKDIKLGSTPRVRFEAISVGVHLALKENDNFESPNIEWLNSEGFKIQTTSDSSNNPNRLKNRIEFVRDGLLGRLNQDRLKNG